MKKVVICQHRLMHYRMGLFNGLRAACQARGIDLHLVHGQATRRELIKKDEGTLDWARKVRNSVWEVGERDWIWQPYPSDLSDADLVVVMQESRILSNYPLLLSRLWSSRKMAYWGHGVNFQSDAPNGLREQWKRLMLTKVDWWFAYTEMTVDILKAGGYPSDRITCLNNAIDNIAFENDLASITDADVQSLRAQVGATTDSPIGLFCGSLYPDKKIGFMVEAADRIQAAIPSFRLLVIGDGPSAAEIKEAAGNRPWLHWFGVQKGLSKAKFFKAADIIINPGLVGLHILDSFCAGKPMITTAEARHSPEIAYLKNGVNGFISAGGAAHYADLAIGLLSSAERLQAAKLAALSGAKEYTLNNMIERFADGMRLALEAR